MASCNTFRGSKSLPRQVRPASPATPVPFRSANPEQLYKMEDSRMDFTETNGNKTIDVTTRLSPIRTRTMKEYDQLIDDLKKENFSLKLRIYFLEERIQQKLGRGSSFEDIHKANIELRVEVEGLKKDVVDKHGLLVAASNALEALEAQQKSEIKKLTSEREDEKRRLLQRIEQLEKLLEKAGESDQKIDRGQSLQWFKAFSFMDQLSEGENSDSPVNQVGISSMQQKMTELEIVIGDLNDQVSKSQSRIETLESELGKKDEQLEKQATKSTLLKKSIQGLLVAIRERDKELEQSNKDKSKCMKELERAKEEIKESEDIHVASTDESSMERMQSLESEIAIMKRTLEHWEASIEKIKTSLDAVLQGCDGDLSEKCFGDVFSKLASFLKCISMLDVRRVGEHESGILGESLDRLFSLLNSKAGEISSLEADRDGLSRRMTDLESHIQEVVEQRDYTKQQLADAAVQLEFLLNERLNCGDDSENSNVNRDQLVHELKDEISKLGLQMKLMSHLNDVLKQRIECASASEVNHDEQLKRLARNAEMLASKVQNFNTDADQTFICPTKFQFITKQLKESFAEIKRLKFLLSSTEATVRMFSSRVKHYRRQQAENHLSGPMLSTPRYSRHHSFTNFDSGTLNSSLIGPEIKVTKRGSSSAPVTPIKNDPPLVAYNCSDAVTLEKEVCLLRSDLDCKEQMIATLRADFERTRPRCSCNDIAVQTVCDGTWKDVSASHNACELLRCRLEELADFLEQLLQFDDRGFLDLSVLTPQRLSSIRGYINKSRELSATLSQSLTTYNDGVSFAPKSSTDARETSVSLHEDGVVSYDDDESTVVSSRDGKATRSPGERKSCDRSLAFDSVSAKRHPRPIRDEFLLHLTNAEQNETVEQPKTVDELPSFSLLSSTFQKSFLASTNVNMSLNGSRLGDHDASESDSWSEPDRGVSQQRIGLEGSQLILLGKTASGSPRRLVDFMSTTSTESEMVTEISKRLGQKAVHKWRANVQELSSLKAHVHELEELNESLRSELVLYQQVCYVGGSTSASTKSLSPRARNAASRRSRNRSGDALANSSRCRLEDHLLEISALRKQLEESIRTYDQLREQLEKKLLKMCEEGSRSGAVEYELAVSQLYSQIEERDAALRNLHKEKSNLLLETQQLCEDVRIHQETVHSLRTELSKKDDLLNKSSSDVNEMKSALALKEKALSGSQAEVNQLRESLSKAKELLSENEVTMKDLHDANNALKRDMDRVIGQLEKEAKEELDVKDEVIAELEAEAQALRQRIEEAAIVARKTFDEQIKLKEVEIKDGQSELESLKHQSSCLQKVFEETRTQLQAAEALNRSMKTEMSMYERMVVVSKSSSRESGLENCVSQLMSEIRSLRLQLERSIEVNVALRAKLEGSGASLRLYIDGSDRCASSISMPDTASSFCFTAAENEEQTYTSTRFGIDRQISKSSDYVSDGPKEAEERRWHGTSERTDGTVIYSSPDLGIESDPSRFSSLERQTNFSLQKPSHYLEPGIPGSNSDWMNVASAPPNPIVCVLSVASDPKRVNCTFPLLGSISNESADSESEVKQQIYSIVDADSFKVLEKGVFEALDVLVSIRSKAKDRILAIRGLSTSKDVDYAAWKELCIQCNSLRSSLREAKLVLEQFYNIPLPLISDADSCIGSMDSKENCCLEGELLRLHRELAKERKRAEDALKKLEDTNRAKDGMEKAIIKQLNKTHCVLKKARGNLENQQQNCVSGTTDAK